MRSELCIKYIIRGTIMKIKVLIMSSIIFLFNGCTHNPLPGSNKVLELPNYSAAEGCKFIKKSGVLNMLGFGHDMHVENAKILMINDVIKNHGNAYIQHYLSAGFGEAGNARYSIYKCPEDYNINSSKKVKSNKYYSNKLKELKEMYIKELITKDEYDKKREELISNY